MKRAYLDRARHLGDADFVKIPAHLTTKQYAAKLAEQIDRNKATPSQELAPDIKLAGEGTSTTHFSVIDADGMAVSNTYTLENSYGSRVVVQGGGFLLNNEMGDFNWKPGHTDRRGRIGTEANTIQPGKRMLSSQCPTLVARNGRVVLVTGSPGGRTIINTSLAIVLNVLEFEMPLADAVAAPRLHHQWLPDLAKFEGATDERHAAMVKQLRAMGHTLNEKPYRQGDAHSIYVLPNPGSYLGVADFRRSGSAAGY
jgi:gamma-glutamyltranspeptidase/glutathione hydrolase